MIQLVRPVSRGEQGTTSERQAEEGELRATPTPALVARLVERHHAAVRRALPSIAPKAARVAEVHGGRDDRLTALHAAFTRLAALLAPHLEADEAVLSPARGAPAPEARAAAKALADCGAEHRAAAALLAEIRVLTDGLTPPAWACTTYRLLVAELAALEVDVLAHVSIVDEHLAPRLAGP